MMLTIHEEIMVALRDYELKTGRKANTLFITAESLEALLLQNPPTHNNNNDLRYAGTVYSGLKIHIGKKYMPFSVGETMTP